MKEKLQILIQNENLTPSGLARKLEVNPPVVSHILKGRNQPSYELIRRIINRFPHINPYWLLGDSSEMYNPAANQSEQSGTSVQHELFPTSAELHDKKSFAGQNQAMKSGEDFNLQELSHNSSRSTGPEIDRIIITYKDGTFESLIPKK